MKLYGILPALILATVPAEIHVSGFVIPLAYRFPLANKLCCSQTGFSSFSKRTCDGLNEFGQPVHNCIPRTRPGFLKLRANLDVGALFKGADPPPEKILRAVEAAGRRVTSADIATAAGVSLNQATSSLSTLAMLTGGNLEVSNDGQIVYVFDPSFRNTLRARSAKQKLAETWAKIAPVLFYLVRISFGVALVTSIALIFSAIFLVQSSSSSSRDEREDRRDYSRGGMSFNLFGPIWGPSPFDLFWYNPYEPYGRNRYRNRDDMSFLEAVFSFLFGDGNPNEDLEERRTRAIAQVIRANGGVVTAEQLAPFLEPPGAFDPAAARESATVDESYVLPAVVALQGDAQVTEDGDIVYIFEDLSVTAQSSLADRPVAQLKAMARDQGLNPNAYFDKNELARALQEKQDRSGVESQLVSITSDYLQEAPIQFSLASSGQTAGVALLAAANLFGALYLGNLLSNPYLIGRSFTGLLGFTQAIYPGLVVYAVALLALPAARYLTLQRTNDAIKSRNALRQSWARGLARTKADITKKLAAGRALLGGRGRVGARIGKSDIAYSTADEVDVDADELRRWDEKYGGGGGGAGGGGGKK